MKEFVEKLIGRLENRIKYNELCHKEFPNAKMNFTYEVQINAYKNAIEIVNQLAEEYNNGWISVSDRLPEVEGYYLVTRMGGNGMEVDISEYEHGYMYNNGFHKAFRVIAWMPLPGPYQKGE